MAIGDRTMTTYRSENCRADGCSNAAVDVSPYCTVHNTFGARFRLSLKHILKSWTRPFQDLVSRANKISTEPASRGVREDKQLSSSSELLADDLKKRPALAASGEGTPRNERGKAFEGKIGAALDVLASQCPESVKIRTQPLFKLYNGEVLKPDFELVYTQPPHRNIRIIECQSRAKSSHDIVHKIRQMKSLSPHNRFIFVYETPDFLSDSVRRNLDSDGIVYYSYEEFIHFILELGVSLKLTAPLAEANEKGKLAEFVQAIPVFDPGNLPDFNLPSKVVHKDEGMLGRRRY